MTAPSSNSPSRFPFLRWLLILVLLIVVAVLVWHFWPKLHGRAGGGSLASGGRPPMSFRSLEGPVPVRVEAAAVGDFPLELKALGTVTAFNTVSVRGRVDGQLVKVPFQEGQRVKAGDVLAVIDPRPYQVTLEQAEGTLQENRAQLKNAELDLARYQGLYKEDSIAKQTLDTQQALVDQYRGTIRSNEAAVDQAKLNLQFTQIRAPIAGRLGLRQVDVGNLVSSGDTTPLVTITQTQPIAVAFTLPEADLPQVLQQVRADRALSVEAWDRAEQRKLADGRLQSLDNQIDTTTGTVKLKATFENTDEMLFPNQFVNVRLRVDVRRQVVLVPSAALQYGSQGTFVYVVRDNKASVRMVTPGPGDGQRTLIEKGLAAGDQVVLEGTDRLREGAEVQIVGDNQPEEAVPATTAPVRSGEKRKKPEA
jgi:multidrug efflux system membrane fusion protein